MQSLIVGTRYAYRAFTAGLIDDIRNAALFSHHNYAPVTRPVSLVTATSGISKSPLTPDIVSKWSYGDDAYFVAKCTGADVIGVADGVGGWRSYGVDPSQFPRSLMSVCERLVHNGHFRPQEPIDIISKGYNEILQNKSQLIGSCTACLVALDKEDKTLYSANLGDSGFLIIRRGSVVHRSEEQQHYFNTPFQLAVAPSTLEGVVLADSPDSAQTSSFGVVDGDIILVGTDGLFDNLSDDMILHHVSKLKGNRAESVQCVANTLCHAANELAFDPDYMSPFAENAAANGFNIKGGKPDDITVVLARVTEDGLEVT